MTSNATCHMIVVSRTPIVSSSPESLELTWQIQHGFVRVPPDPSQLSSAPEEEAGPMIMQSVSRGGKGALLFPERQRAMRDAAMVWTRLKRRLDDSGRHCEYDYECSCRLQLSGLAGGLVESAPMPMAPQSPTAGMRVAQRHHRRMHLLCVGHPNVRVSLAHGALCSS